MGTKWIFQTAGLEQKENVFHIHVNKLLDQLPLPTIKTDLKTGYTDSKMINMTGWVWPPPV